MGKVIVGFIAVWILVMVVHKLFVAMNTKEKVSLGKSILFGLYTALVSLVIVTSIVSLF